MIRKVACYIGWIVTIAFLLVASLFSVIVLMDGIAEEYLEQ